MGRRNHLDFDNLQMSRKVSEWLYQEIAHSKKHISHVAKALGISEWNLYKYTDPESASNNFPAFLLPRFTKAVGKGLLEKLAWESGYLLVPVPKVNGKVDQQALELVAQEAKEHAEAVEEFARAVADGRVTQRELERVKKEAFEALEKLLELVKYAEKIAEKEVRRQ